MDRLDPSGLVNAAADWHLQQWARWMRGYEVGIGFKNRSGVLNSPASSTFDEMCERQDRLNCRICDGVLSELTPQYQGAIHNVYLASVYRHRGDPVEIFKLAVAKFWELAQKKGLS